jgi:hypothetical protein
MLYGRIGDEQFPFSEAGSLQGKCRRRQRVTYNAVGYRLSALRCKEIVSFLSRAGRVAWRCVLHVRKYEKRVIRSADKLRENVLCMTLRRDTCELSANRKQRVAGGTATWHSLASSTANSRLPVSRACPPLHIRSKLNQCPSRRFWW